MNKRALSHGGKGDFRSKKQKFKIFLNCKYESKLQAFVGQPIKKIIQIAYANQTLVEETQESIILVHF